MRVSVFLSQIYYLTFIGYLSLFNIFVVEFNGNHITIFDGLFLLLLLGCILLSLLHNLNWPLWYSSLNKTVAAYIGILVLFPFAGLLLGDFSIGVLSPSVRHFQYFLFLPVTGLLLKHRLITVRGLYLSLLVICMLHISASVMEFMGMIDFAEYVGSATVHEHRYRRSGLFGSISQFGILMGTVCMAGIGGYISPTVRDSIPALVAFLGLTGIIFAGHRTGLVITIPGLLLLFVYTNMKMKTILVGSVFTLFTVINSYTSGWITDQFLQISLILTGDIDQFHSFAVRVGEYQEGIILIREFGIFGTLVDHSFVSDVGAHGYYLSLFFQTGFPGIAVYLLMLGTLVLSSMIAFAHNEEAGVIPMLVGLSVAIGSLTLPVMGYTSVQVLFWISLGIVYGKHTKSEISVRIR